MCVYFTLFMERQQPLEALELIASHRASNNAFRLASGRGPIHIYSRIVCRCELVLAQDLERVEHSFGHKWLQLPLESREKGEVATLEFLPLCAHALVVLQTASLRGRYSTPLWLGLGLWFWLVLRGL